MTPEQKAAAAAALAQAKAETGLAATASAQEQETPEGGAAAVAAAAAATAAATDTTDTTQEQPSTDVVASLTEKLEARAVELAGVKAQLATAQEALQASQATMASLGTIVQASIRNMGVAMGTQIANLDKLEPAALVETHVSVSTQFLEKFKAGGTSANDKQTQATAQADAPVFTEQDVRKMRLG